MLMSGSAGWSELPLPSHVQQPQGTPGNVSWLRLQPSQAALPYQKNTTADMLPPTCMRRSCTACPSRSARAP